MSYYCPWQSAPQCLGESDQPGLPDSALKSSSVLPVDVYSIQLVLQHVVGDAVGARHWVYPLTGGELCGSEGTDHQFYSFVVKQSQEGRPDLLVSRSEGSGPEVLRGPIPEDGSVEGSLLAGVEGEAEVGVGVGGVAWDSDGLG